MSRFEHFINDFAQQAEFRRTKADEYPEDPRNLRAAALLDQLSESVSKCPEEVLVAVSELIEGNESDVFEWLAMLKQVGFGYSPQSAEEFCRNFIAARTTGARW